MPCRSRARSPSWIARFVGLVSFTSVAVASFLGVAARAEDDLTWRASDAVETEQTLLRWNHAATPEGGPPGWDEPLASDRPDFTEASSTVGRGVTQLELGYTFFFDDESSGSINSHSFPEILVRRGFLADWLEFRVGWTLNSETQTLSGTSGTAHGSDDLYLGLKLGLTPQQGWLPEMSLMPQMSVPLGGIFSANRVLPGLNWLYGWDVTERLSVGASTQYNLSVDEFKDRVHGEFAQSATLGIALREQLSGFIEWFVFCPAGAETEKTEHYLDGGLTYRWSNNLQLDVRLGTGLSAASTDLFAGTGMVVRF